MSKPVSSETGWTGAHTPLPWRIGWEHTVTSEVSEWAEIPLASGWSEDAWTKSNATDESRANAELIVRAVNSHQSLYEALREARELLLERKQGSPARSAGHNARLVIEAALKLADGHE